MVTTPELRLAVIEELGPLEEKLAALDVDTKRRDLLRKAARQWPTEDLIHSEQAIAYKGKRYVLTFGPQDNETSIRSMTAVYKKLKQRAFLQKCTLTLKALKEALPTTWEQYTETKRTGSRGLTVARAV